MNSCITNLNNIKVLYFVIRKLLRVKKPTFRKEKLKKIIAPLVVFDELYSGTSSGRDRPLRN